jgi:hypothetical protein
LARRRSSVYAEPRAGARLVADDLVHDRRQVAPAGQDADGGDEPVHHRLARVAVAVANVDVELDLTGHDVDRPGAHA